MDSLLLTLALLACPIGMGAMMFMMSRGGQKNDGGDPREREIRQMRTEIDRLKAEQESDHNRPVL